MTFKPTKTAATKIAAAPLADALADFDEAWLDRERRDEAKFIATTLVDAHPEDFKKFEELSIEQLVVEVDRCRRDGDDQRRLMIDAWIQAKVAPRRIEGALNPGG